MGNVSSVREGLGEGQPMVEEQVDSSNPQGGSQDLMGQSPPSSPRGAAQSPLLFAPQMPMVPMHRLDETRSPCNAWMRNYAEYEEVLYEQGIPTMITWSYGGQEVSVEGSWDNWMAKKILQKSGKDFTIMKVLPSGVYHYRFIVDGEWRYAPDMPWMRDEMGNVYNILDLQKSVPEDLGSIAGFEPPQSPESSYDNRPLGAEDYAKEPPLTPPQLQNALLNTPPSAASTSSLLRPQHAVLNHLYIQKGKIIGEPVVALSETHRFMGKHVTVVLYKPAKR